MIKLKQKRSASIKTNWIIYSFVITIILLQSCNSNDTEDKNNPGLLIEQQVLDQYGLSRDKSNDSLLNEVIKGINCIAVKELKRKLVFTSEFKQADTSSILVIPFQSLLGDFTSCAYSDISNKIILLSPQLIIAFNKANTLNDTTSLGAVVALMLLHELGHFSLGKEGAFDAPSKTNKFAQTGQLKMNTEPEYINSLKRTELSADSIAISFVKKYANDYKQMDCYGVASDIEIVLPGIGFQLFGSRMIGQFGSSTIDLLRDPSTTHPNLELRMAFMNYFMSNLPQQKEMIDKYLYDREVAPVHRQETDPRIYQSDRKILPGDTDKLITH